ncbi:MAG: sugar kinase, partial [Desulfosporosinus sp.]
RWSGQLFTKDQQDGYNSRQYDLTSICDRVGTGDSFAAGIIFGLNFLNDYQKTIDFAVALSALNHTTIGEFSYFTINDVEKMISTNGSGCILR